MKPCFKYHQSFAGLLPAFRSAMKPILLSTLLLLFSLTAGAQGKDKSRVQAIKTSFIADRLKLTPSQAEQFWPMYNRCQAERRNLKQSYGGAKARPGQDPEEAMRFLDDNIEFKQRDLAIQKRCNDEYLRVLSPQQTAALVEAERDFRKMLLDELRERKH